MKCPYCNYINGYDFDENKIIHGTEGDFFMFPIKMEREGIEFHSSGETASVYGCPKCNKIFIER